MNLARIGLFVFCIALMSGCEAKSESLSYQYSVNGCDTGKHDFSSNDEYCAGLKDYKGNNYGCAYSLRKDAYERASCAGTFEETNR